VRIPAKKTRWGPRAGARQAWKKAYVRLAPGQDINFMGAEA
jgi:large subunit ribosomal protein L23